jgi:aspartate kinase
VVQKYGGTSVATVENIRRVAARALSRQRSGCRVVVVVSAMAGETNRLLALAGAISDSHDREAAREYDVIASAGEPVVAGLTALAIMALGGSARSLFGHQVALHTSDNFGDADVRAVDVFRLDALLRAGTIPVVTGFQGVNAAGDTTTLGRGGSDTTAVALAAVLGAEVCEIYTDVDAVYAADPRVHPEAARIERIDYDRMLAMARAGAKVLHAKSVELARRHRVAIHVRSSFTDEPGTWVTANSSNDFSHAA